ncbi:MAG: peptidylprolyl isomerase [Candidatus Moranbacteria bacterium]|nr:peptidylprolyl isomerase [Candidatus Moranbacteria bacterium]
MQTKKILSVAGLFIALILFSGCASDNSADKSGVASGLLGVPKKAQDSIAKSTDQENANLNNSLNESNNMSSNAPKAPVISQDLIKKYPFATIKTSLGDIKVKFNGTATPLTVTNFLQLAQLKFYENTKFHRVIKGFMIQAGDPLSKNSAMKSSWGSGGPGYKFKDELTGTEKYPQGTLAMANSGPNTNGSQFFIVTANPSAMLDPNYTVFGEVVSGLDTALKIENVKTTTPDRPVEDVVITSVVPVEK